MLAALVFLALSPSLRNGFTGYDDPEYVTNNTHVNTGLSRQNIAWAFTAAHSSNWHPLTWISHALDCTWFGLAPAGHHFTNLLLHTLNTVLLFLWLSGVTGSSKRSAFVALVFGLHPLHVESVAWVSERKDVLSTFFGMLSLLAYSAYVRRPGAARYLLMASLFAAGLLAKPMLVTMPLLLLVLDWWPLQRTTPAARLALEKLPLLLLSALSCVVTLWAQRQGGAVSSMEQLPLSLRLGNAAVSYVRYLGKTVWPTRLAVFYPFPLHGIPTWTWVASIAALTALSCFTFALRRDHPWFASGWCWYLLTLLPVIGIVQVGMQAMADRYMYVPMIGLLLAVTWECAEALGHSRTGAVLLALSAALLLAMCTVLSWQQVQVWKDGVTLFTHALSVTHDNFVAEDNLGVELDQRGRPDEARAHYRETLRIKPGDRHGEANYAQASFAKGQRLFEAGKLDESLAQFQEGIRYRPLNALAHSQMGQIQTQRHQLDAAIAEFQAAVRIDPTLAAAHMGLAVAFAWSGQGNKARQAFEDTLRYDPGNVEAHYDLGLVLATAGQNAEALRSFDAAVRLNPGFGPGHVARAETLAALGRYEEAWRAVLAARAAHAEVDPALVSALAVHVRR
ncbi:MAG TPA: tetratricopeptide repeat protein [Bryobacteraceae bacterium]